ncbi:MAG: HAD-IA family hydrolase [Pseudomonadota bacterium]
MTRPNSLPTPKAILFDLDGTFADTAPDMAFAANVLLKARKMDTLPLSEFRPHVSLGGRGMIKVAFGIGPEDAEFVLLRDEFLDVYEQNLCRNTMLFEGMNETAAALERHHIAWGIVTNKSMRFTDPLLKQLGIDRRAGCIVSGDTTPHTKPHPAPLLHAAALLGVEPETCWYVGDDERDIIAAHAAGMKSIIALYGYLGGTDPATWNAHAAVYTPLGLLDLFDPTPMSVA